MNYKKLAVATTASSARMFKPQTRAYRKGERIVRAGSVMQEWIAISGGTASVKAVAAANAKVAVAVLWFGDIVGWRSPIGQSVAEYDVYALADVETVILPGGVGTAHNPCETAHLYTATASRLNRQIAMRLAGNGPQRLMSVLATLGESFSSGRHSHHTQAVPVARTCLGQLAGLSRRQIWVYLAQLARAGWVETSHTRVVLQDFSSWRALRSEVERRGPECTSTIERAVETLSDVAGRALKSRRTLAGA